MATMTMSSTLFKRIQTALHLNNEVRMQFTADGLKVKLVDPSHVAMTSLEVPKSAFVKYDAAEPNDVHLDLDKWKEVGKLASTSDNVDIEIKDGSITYKVGNIRRRARLLEGENADVKIPNLKLPGKATVNVEEMRRAVKATTDEADFVTITLNEVGITIESKSDTCESSMNIPNDFIKDKAIEGTARSLFPMDFFTEMVGGLPDGLVELNIGNDLPMKFVCAGDMNITCLIAPRIENEG